MQVFLNFWREKQEKRSGKRVEKDVESSRDASRDVVSLGEISWLSLVLVEHGALLAGA
jgi:hypothetical protein